MKKQLNILNIGPVPPRIGGSAFVNIETMIGLAEKGHRVRCISQLSKEHLEKPDYDFSWRGTSVEVFPIEAPFIQSSKPLTDEEIKNKQDIILDRFHTLVDGDIPDVVMIGHESYAFYANEEARKIGIPVVQVLHGTPTHMIDEGVYPEDLTKRFLDSVNEATLVIGVSNYLANIVRKHGIKQTTYIHNGTDTNKFKPKEFTDEEFLASLGLELRNRVLLHASTLRPVKRPLDIVESAHYALQKDPDLRYVIVGDGVLRENMEERAEELGVSEYFRFVGRIDFESIPKYFQHANMFLLPSEHEGFGRVIREAQACSTVPIASNVGPLTEVIEDNETGCLFEKGNLKGLSSKILELAGNGEYREKIAKQARDAAVASNLVTMVDKYESALISPLDYLRTAY